MLHANGYEMVQAFNFERLHPSFNMRIHQRGLDRYRIWLHAFAPECFIKLPRVEHIVVAYKNGGGFKSELVHHHWKAFGNLAHPIVGGVLSCFRDQHLSTLYMHKYKRRISLEPFGSEHFLCEEIA